MASPVKIDDLQALRIYRFSAQAIVAAPGAVPGSVETTVTLPDTVPIGATVLASYIGTTPAARGVNQSLFAYVKHDDGTKIIFKWTQTAGTAAAIPAGDYQFVVFW